MPTTKATAVKATAVKAIHRIPHVNFPTSDIAATEEWCAKVSGVRTIDMNRDW
jgi:hypothetical protein